MGLSAPMPRSSDVALSVVIPAHNSARVLASTVGRFAEYLADVQAEIIVVENGSTDDTGAVCRRLEQSWDHTTVSLHITTSAKGLGNALRVGVAHSSGSRVLLTADDLPFGFDDLDAARAIAADTGHTPLLMIGSKGHPDSVVSRGMLRTVMTTGFGVLRRVVLGTHAKDPQGTFLVDGDLLRSVAGSLVEPGFLFTTELDYALELAGVDPVELPVRLSESHRDEPSRVAGGDVMAMAKGLVSLRKRKSELKSAAQYGLQLHR